MAKYELGREFSYAMNMWFDESNWDELVKLSKSNRAVAQVDEFRYNVNDVCLNPNRHKFEVPGMLKCEVLTAKQPNDRWVFGHDFEYQDGGNMGPASWKAENNPRVFRSEKAAIEGGLRLAIWVMERREDSKSTIKALQQLISSQRQLSLFE